MRDLIIQMCDGTYKWGTADEAPLPWAMTLCDGAPIDPNPANYYTKLNNLKPRKDIHI